MVPGVMLPGDSAVQQETGAGSCRSFGNRDWFNVNRPSVVRHADDDVEIAVSRLGRTREEEAFYVLSGRLAVWVDGTEQVAEPGAFLLVPRGVPHAARRVTDEPVRMLTLVSPSGVQRFFESVVREGEEELLAHPARLATLAAEFGSEILGDYPNL